MAEVTVSGNLGATPELKYTTEGHPWARLAIAENLGRGKDKTCIWWEGIIYGSFAINLCGWLEKGMSVTVRGKLKLEAFEVEGQTRIGRTVFVSAVGPVSSNGAGKAKAATEDTESTENCKKTQGPRVFLFELCALCG